MLANQDCRFHVGDVVKLNLTGLGKVSKNQGFYPKIENHMLTKGVAHVVAVHFQDEKKAWFCQLAVNKETEIVWCEERFLEMITPAPKTQPKTEEKMSIGDFFDIPFD